MIGISSGIGTPKLPSKRTAKTPRYVKLSTNSWSASTASSRANDAAPAHVPTLTQCSRVHLVRVPRGPRGTPGDRNLVDVARGRVAERYAGVEREFADLPLQRLLFQVRIH